MHWYADTRDLHRVVRRQRQMFIRDRPMDDAFVKRWQLACEEDIAHVVVMPNVTRSKIDTFVDELMECTEKHGRVQPLRHDSPLTMLSGAW